MLVSYFGLPTSFLSALRAIGSMGKRPQDQGSTSRKRFTPTRPATEQTPEIPAGAEATMHDPGNASILRCSDSAVEPDAATEHIAPASFGSAGEASSGCDDMTINSLDDVISKLSSDCAESASDLRNAVQTLQRGVQAEIRTLCNRWGVQLTAKNDNGKYSKRADHILKNELKDTFIAKASTLVAPSLYAWGYPHTNVGHTLIGYAWGNPCYFVGITQSSFWIVCRGTPLIGC